MGGNLIYYAIVFLIVAIVAAALGFGGVAGTAISGAHLLLMVAVVFIVVGLLAGVLRRTATSPGAQQRLGFSHGISPELKRFQQRVARGSAETPAALL